MASEMTKTHDILSGSDILPEGATTKLMVAAIDFGTTYSGWAFSFKTDFDSDPTSVNCKKWNNSTRLSEKAPTTVLVKPDGVTLEAFGYAAEDKYAQLVAQDKHKSYFYFRNFKMMLYENQNLTNNEQLEDITGKQLQAKRVFTMAIKFLKDDCLIESSDKLLTGVVPEDEILWVLTVPAIWNIRAKQFMRECAVEAGIKSSNLVLALEPEAASLYCKHLSLQRRKVSPNEAAQLSTFQPGTTYMVVDAGGGTVDVVIHKVNASGSLEELLAANGGNWGGTTVDQAFLDLITNIFGRKVIYKFKANHMDDFLELQRSFDLKKRSMTSDVLESFHIKIPTSLIDTYKKMKWKSLKDKIRENVDYRGHIELKRDKMSIDRGMIERVFDETIRPIVRHIQNVFQDKSIKDTNIILMVGGFSESPMLSKAMKAAFPDKLVFVPQGPSLSVLVGAVIYGHSSKEINTRISQYTYGVKMYQSFDPTVHPEERMVKINEKIFAENVFKPLIHKGDILTPFTVSKPHTVSPVHGGSEMVLQIYASRNESMYVDDPGCINLGKLGIDCRDENGKIGGVDIYLMLGGTEFEVHAVSKSTERTSKATFNFLE